MTNTTTPTTDELAQKQSIACDALIDAITRAANHAGGPGTSFEEDAELGKAAREFAEALEIVADLDVEEV